MELDDVCLFEDTWTTFVWRGWGEGRACA